VIKHLKKIKILTMNMHGRINGRVGGLLDYHKIVQQKWTWWNIAWQSITLTLEYELSDLDACDSRRSSFWSTQFSYCSCSSKSGKILIALVVAGAAAASKGFQPVSLHSWSPTKWPQIPHLRHLTLRNCWPIPLWIARPASFSNCVRVSSFVDSLEVMAAVAA